MKKSLKNLGLCLVDLCFELAALLWSLLLNFCKAVCHSIWLHIIALCVICVVYYKSYTAQSYYSWRNELVLGICLTIFYFTAIIGYLEKRKENKRKNSPH